MTTHKLAIDPFDAVTRTASCSCTQWHRLVGSTAEGERLHHDHVAAVRAGDQGVLWEQAVAAA